MRIRTTLFTLTAFTLTLAAGSAHAQLRLPQPSPKASVMQTIGTSDLTVSYSRPGVKGREGKIWGELLPYDKPWRAGANAATTLTTTDEVTFGGQKLAAGTYAIVMTPGKDEWTVSLSPQEKLW